MLAATARAKGRPMSEELIRRHARAVPRYTSYPTAPHFHAGVDGHTYSGWLSALPAATPLSIYMHVPFCDRLCWFCGCHTKQVLRYDPIAAYLPALHKEIATVSGLLAGRGKATALHLGGGSPSMLTPPDLLALADGVRQQFSTASDMEFSIEVDPNDMTDDRYDGFAAAGVTRISIGVQDFDEKVQRAINRLQSVEQTRAVVDGVRARGVRSVNLDVLYGLPHQTTAGLLRTIDLVLDMRPDRIALFGYAHVPWMKTHQRMIDEAALPNLTERFRQSQAAAARIVAAGYRSIGIDHFALPSDSLAVAAASGHLHRNFQGYTTDAAPALLGFGASAIGGLPQGYVQNVTATGQYLKAVETTGLAIARGVALTEDDRTRRWVIEQLMCNFAVPVADLTRVFGVTGKAVLEEMYNAVVCDGDGLVTFDGETYAVTELGKPFVRTIASAFDTYLAAGLGRHSAAV
jgi:oxygen-independent coproporphyrinogen III oxidase